MNDLAERPDVDGLLDEVLRIGNEEVWLIHSTDKKLRGIPSASLCLIHGTEDSDDALRHWPALYDRDTGKGDDALEPSVCGLSCQWFKLGAFVDCRSCGEYLEERREATKMTRVNAREIEDELLAMRQEHRQAMHKKPKRKKRK